MALGCLCHCFDPLIDDRIANLLALETITPRSHDRQSPELLSSAPPAGRCYRFSMKSTTRLLGELVGSVADSFETPSSWHATTAGSSLID